MKTINAEELDRRFDDGEDISEYMNWSKAKRPGRIEKQQTVRISLDVAPTMLKALDTESERIAITHQALIKELIDDGLARRRARAA
ncbi:MAG: hypothetical protein IKZ87_06965 [Actinomycetaceae bacterium]|nr:hypothetical protein [Actinomycetaceae bacterium]